jgi:hypothetical protein
MRKCLFLAAGLACACGTDSSGDASTDYGSNFAGLWVGTLEERNSSGTLGSTEVAVNLEETSRNYLKIYNACVAYSGPTVKATSATEFSSIAPYSCPAVGNEDCGSVVITWTSVTGTLEGTTLQFTANLSGALCGTTVQTTATFTGERSSD